jgi:hypothetical protein
MILEPLVQLLALLSGMCQHSIEVKLVQLLPVSLGDFDHVSSQGILGFRVVHDHRNFIVWVGVDQGNLRRDILDLKGLN